MTLVLRLRQSHWKGGLELLSLCNPALYILRSNRLWKVWIPSGPGPPPSRRLQLLPWPLLPDPFLSCWQSKQTLRFSSYLTFCRPLGCSQVVLWQGRVPLALSFAKDTKMHQSAALVGLAHALAAQQGCWLHYVAVGVKAGTAKAVSVPRP